MTQGAAIVLVTAPSREVAEHLVTSVVEERLAACGNIVPGITSIYRWQGAIQKDEELLIVFKTTRAAAAQLMTRVEALHPYDVPEALVLPVEAGLAPYMSWVAANSDGISGDDQERGAHA
jgi:periplasmic divalent cation tolerance protein